MTDHHLRVPLEDVHIAFQEFFSALKSIQNPALIGITTPLLPINETNSRHTFRVLHHMIDSNSMRIRRELPQMNPSTPTLHECIHVASVGVPLISFENIVPSDLDDNERTARRKKIKEYKLRTPKTKDVSTRGGTRLKNRQHVNERSKRSHFQRNYR